MKSRVDRSLPLIALERCSIVLDGQAVLDDVSFALGPRERWALVGSNGSGKTMLLKLLRGDLWPTPSGVESRVYRLDTDAGEAGSPQPVGSKQRIAYIGPEQQDKYLRRDWNLDVTEVVTTGLFHEDIPLNEPTRQERALVARLLHRFSLWPLRSRRFLTLSYGQRRLVLIARAFAGNPAVLLLDEVFNGLDTASRERLRSALEKSGSRGPAWILSTHRAAELPLSLTHIAHIKAGRMLDAGPIKPGRSSRLKAAPVVSLPLATASPRRRSSAGGPLVSIRHATVYRDYRPVLKSFDWTLNEGEHWAIMGRNGSGKSTLLSLIYGDLQPALGGTIERRGLPPGAHIERWKRRVGFVSPELQAEHFRAASIEEIVISGRYASIGLNLPPTAADRKAARRWLKFFGLLPLAARGPRAVSYGQMRLALLARAMVRNPELLLLDEPVTGLDADLRVQLLCFIEQLAHSGRQVVMAVHHEADLIPSVRHLLKVKAGGRVALEVRQA